MNCGTRSFRSLASAAVLVPCCMALLLSCGGEPATEGADSTGSPDGVGTGTADLVAAATTLSCANVLCAPTNYALLGSSPGLSCCGGSATKSFAYGQFCSPGATVTQWICGVYPSGSGWVPQAGGCYHRGTSSSCGRFCAPNRTWTDWMCGGTPSGTGWVAQAGGCYHRGSTSPC